MCTCVNIERQRQDVHIHRQGFPGGLGGEESACKAGDLSFISGREDPLEKGMATHPSIVAWRIPWTEEPSRLQSMGSKVTNTFTFKRHTSMYYMCVHTDKHTILKKIMNLTIGLPRHLQISRFFFWSLKTTHLAWAEENE